MANPAARSDAARQSRGGEHPPSGARACVPRALPVGEIFVVLALALLFFGPAKLPALGASVRAAIRGFKRGLTSADLETEKPTLLPPDPQ